MVSGARICLSRDMPKIAVVAALEREIGPLVAGWRVVRRSSDGREFKFFESDVAVVVCGGIGPAAARRACEAVCASYGPEMVISAGFAGALNADLHAGDVVVPARVIDAGDGSSVETGTGSRGLVSVAETATVERKRVLGAKYDAVAVDMEAAAVAKAAGLRAVRFVAVKAISDELDFEIPVAEGSVDAQGQFHEGRFLAGMARRPWIWGQVVRLARNSSLASRKLSEALGARMAEYGSAPGRTRR
jgi:adenosylhomocysteine nucleosidase